MRMRIPTTLFNAVACVLVTGCTAQQSASTTSRVQVYDVRSFGAVGDGKADDTAAFQRALDDCAGAAGGGEVRVGAGEYLMGSIELKSRTTLRLASGATLRGSPNAELYPIMTIRWEGVWRDGHRALIYSHDAEHIAIVGPGRIIGDAPLGHLRNPRGPCIIEPINCTDVRLEGFSIEYERMWAVHPTYCSDVVAKDLHIRSRLSNGDGIDVDSSQHVRIDHCDIDTGDDAIALKSGRGAEGVRLARPTQDVLIRDCTLGSDFAGLAIGTEMSGGVRNVRAQRCTFTRGSNSIYIKSRSGRGGVMEHIAVEDSDAAAQAMLRIDLLSHGIVGVDPIDGPEGIPQVGDVRLTNIRATCPTLVDAKHIAPEKPMQGLSLVSITGTCTRGMELANIRDAELRDLHVTGSSGPMLRVFHVTGTGLEGAADLPEGATTAPATRRATTRAARP